MASVIDGMILDYLVDAMETGYNPSVDDRDLAAEKIAALRLFLWTDLAVGRIAAEQTQRTPDEVRRRRLFNLLAYHLPEVWVQEDEHGAWLARSSVLAAHHRDEQDCRIVAEAEIVRAPALLTFDKRLKKHLQEHSGVKILYPTEQWSELNIPRGTRPRWTPATGNPLANQVFWRWD